MKATILSLLLFAWSAAALAAEKAYFAGGCFWCVEAAYEDLDGVKDVVSGFTGGTMRNPTYSGDHRGHFEAVEIKYDPDVISYQKLLDIFWHNIDPFDNRGQFCDKGFSYRSAIFPVDDEQRALAEASLKTVQAQFAGMTVHTEIRDANRFWPVEE